MHTISFMMCLLHVHACVCNPSVDLKLLPLHSGQSHRDDTSSRSPAVTQQKSSIPSQELKVPPTPVPPKSEESSPTPAGDHKSMSSNTTSTTIDSTHYSMTGTCVYITSLVPGIHGRRKERLTVWFQLFAHA